MAGVSNADLLDLIAFTQEQHPWAPAFEHLQLYHTYEVVNRWLREDAVEIQDGEEIHADLTYREQGTAKHVDLYEQTAPSVINVGVKAKVRWTHAQVHYAYSRVELLQNLRGSRIVDLQKARRLTSLADLANIIEERGWKAPPDTSTTKYPFGIPYWITPITGAQVTANGGQNAIGTGKFQGYLPYAEDATAFADCGGIACSTTAYSRWANWNDTWTNSDGSIGGVDLKRLGRMWRQLGFDSPLLPEDLFKGAARNLRHYVGDVTMVNYEELARLSEDRLAGDIGRFAGATAFKRVPLKWVDQLDADDTYPWYMINHGFFKAIVLRGNRFYEHAPKEMETQPNVFVVWVDLSYNFLVRNRQKCGGMISYVAAA